jgi:hypothetical protein
VETTNRTKHEPFNEIEIAPRSDTTAKPVETTADATEEPTPANEHKAQMIEKAK